MTPICRVRNVQIQSDVVDKKSIFSDFILSTESDGTYEISIFECPGRFWPPRLFDLKMNSYKDHDEILYVI